MNERREISYLLTVEDHIAFNMFLHSRLPFWQRHITILAVGGGLLYGGFLMFTMVPHSERAGGLDELGLLLKVGGLVLMAGIIGALTWRMHPSQLPRRVCALLARPQNQHLVGEKTLSIGPEGITTQDQGAQKFTRWDMIEKVAVTPDHVFFFLTQRIGLILPRRAFQDEDDFAGFMKLAKQYDAGVEDANHSQSDSFSPQPTRDPEFVSETRRASEPATVLRGEDESTAARRNLSFVLTVEDHIAFNMLLHQHLPFWRRYLPFLMLIIVLPAAGILLFSMPTDPRAPELPDLLTKVVILSTLFVIFAGLSAFMVRSQRMKLAQQVRNLLAHPQNRKLVSEVTISITPEEVISRDMTGTTSIRWERIGAIVVTENHAFLFFAECAAITIPKRPRQAEEFEEFVDLARKYHEGTADDQTPPPTPPEERISRSSVSPKPRNGTDGP